MTTLADAAPATAWALHELAKWPTGGPRWHPLNSTTGRAVLLALATQADAALYSPSGYTDTGTSTIAGVVGLAVSTTRRWLLGLAETGYVRKSGSGWRIAEKAFAR